MFQALFPYRFVLHGELLRHGCITLQVNSESLLALEEDQVIYWQKKART